MVNFLFGMTAAIVLATIFSGVYLNLGRKRFPLLPAATREKLVRFGRLAFRANLGLLGVVGLISAGWVLWGGTVLAQIPGAANQGTAAAGGGDALSVGEGLRRGLGYLGAGLATGCASIGAGIGAGVAGAAGIGAISEKPEMLGKSLIYIGLAEGVAIYGLLISFMIFGKLG